MERHRAKIGLVPAAPTTRLIARITRAESFADLREFLLNQALFLAVHSRITRVIPRSSDFSSSYPCVSISVSSLTLDFFSKYSSFFFFICRIISSIVDDAWSYVFN